VQRTGSTWIPASKSDTKILKHNKTKIDRSNIKKPYRKFLHNSITSSSFALFQSQHLRMRCRLSPRQRKRLNTSDAISSRIILRQRIHHIDDALGACKGIEEDTREPSVVDHNSSFRTRLLQTVQNFEIDHLTGRIGTRFKEKASH
jgi:hypothetical protein